ncbi:P-loop containing nucleoside triphosphate hydrolase protein [Mycena vitilis]|nr:P-loop containing nucleoside triphosphate hydrolase protein [Mycena vitilis]
MAVNKTTTQPIFIVVMGVSGTGKSTLGAALAAALHMPYIDGDDLHPRANVEKMSAGQPLTDADREPWLRVIRSTAERVADEQQRAKNDTDYDNSGNNTPETPGVVIACSALKRAYRDILRGGDAKSKSGAVVLPTYFVFIDGSREVLLERMHKRSGHFMKASMLDSQLSTLENPAGEQGVVVVSVEDTTAAQVDKAVVALETRREE